jgi:hypothetical protein
MYVPRAAWRLLLSLMFAMGLLSEPSPKFEPPWRLPGSWLPTG